MKTPKGIVVIWGLGLLLSPLSVILVIAGAVSGQVSVMTLAMTLMILGFIIEILTEAWAFQVLEKTDRRAG